MIYDLCVVGAGMMGSAAARHASTNPGLKVCLIGPDEPKRDEMKDREIFSSHYDEGRITRMLDEHISGQILAKESIDRYRELEKLSGIKFYNPIGFLCVGEKNSSYIEHVKQVAELGHVPVLDLSYPGIMKQRYPYLKLNPDVKVYLDENGAGHISPRNVVAAQQKVASLQGCTIISDVVLEVKELQRNDTDVFHEVLTETGRIIKAKRVLICTGSFTNFHHLIPSVDNMVPDITVLQETAVFLKIPATEAKRLISMPGIIYYCKEESLKNCIGAYILPPIQYPDGFWYLKIGHMDETGHELSTLKEIKDWYLSSGDPSIVKSHSSILMKMLPGLEVLEIRGLSCATCRSPTGLPYIERITPTISIAAVGNGKGAKFSDEVGRIAAVLTVTGKWDSETPQSLFKVVWKSI